MGSPEIFITGIGSVSSFGPVRGLIGLPAPIPRVVTRWPTSGMRRAYLVAPFQPSASVPGLKTRRLDHFSIWSIVAAFLAMQDAQVDLETVNPASVAVILGTGFGCIELTEAYLESITRYGYGSADPIIFPETLTNAPAGHVARNFGFRGPNITVSCRGISGEVAMIQAASLLKAGEADLAIVISGDMLTRTLYEWYEAAGVLSSACFEELDIPAPFSRPADGLFPGEGVAAMVMEPGRQRNNPAARAYARFRGGLTGGEPDTSAVSWGRSPARTVDLTRNVLGAHTPAEVQLVISSANGSPGLDRLEAQVLRTLFDAPPGGTVITAPKVASGELDGNGILRFALALSGKGIIRDLATIFGAGQPDLTSAGSVSPQRGLALLLGASAGGGRAAVALELLRNNH